MGWVPPDMKQSPIFVRTYELMLWLVPRTLAFPRSQRGVLARRIQQQVFGLYETLVDAAGSADPLPHLRQADGTLTKLRAYLRLSHDLHLLSLRQYGHACRLLAEVGRLLGGWIRSIEQATTAGYSAVSRGRSGDAAGRLVEQQ